MYALDRDIFWINMYHLEKDFHHSQRGIRLEEFEI